MMKTKTFDCVEMKRKGGRHVYEQTRGMTPKEELAFWQKRTTQLAKRIKAAHKKKQTKAKR
jgi:hypothetical protein